MLDYDVHIAPLRPTDRTLIYGTLGNYSLAGFEMILHRYVSHYIITYYLPSGNEQKMKPETNIDCPHVLLSLCLFFPFSVPKLPTAASVSMQR